MYMLAGLRSLFIKALVHDYDSADVIIEQWNKECDKVWEYKNEVVAETFYKTAPKVGTWRLESDEEMPDPMFKIVQCSECSEFAYRPYKFCPNCGATMKGLEK